MSNYIMTETLFNQLRFVHGFTEINGQTYREHILIIAGKRIPIHLHSIIREVSSGTAALNILKEHNIPYTHDYGSPRNSEKVP